MNLDNQELPSSQNTLHNERMLLRSFVFCICIAMGIALDQWIKHFIFLQARLPEPLVQFKNYYFAFSIHLPIWFIFTLYAFVLVVAVWYCVRRFAYAKIVELAAWVLLFAGAFSNVGERIVLGYVRDYFLLLHGIFNLADFFIMIGIVLLLIKSETKDGNEQK